MYNSKWEYLKRKIKRNYKWFTGERKDGKAMLNDVTQFFNIDIDETTNNYVINNIDFDNPKIELVDNNTNTKYVSNYSNKVGLLGTWGKDTIYNELLIQSPTYKIEKSYFIGDDSPIIERLTFKIEGYVLEFERESTNKLYLNEPDGIQFTIRYFQELSHGNKNVKEKLLTKVYMDKLENRKKVGSEQEIFTYGSLPYYTDHIVELDKLIYEKNNKTVYEIRELWDKNNHSYLTGICIEHVKGKIKDSYPNSTNDRYSCEYDNGNNNSAMVFWGYGKNHATQHKLQICKQDDYARVKYKIKKKNIEEPETQEFIIQLMDSKDISNNEIIKIIRKLKEKYYGDEFISAVIKELRTFGERIDIRKGLMEEKIDILNPKIYINKPLEGIAKIISEDKDIFFQNVQEQFDAAMNTSKRYKEKKRVLKKESN